MSKKERGLMNSGKSGLTEHPCAVQDIDDSQEERNNKRKGEKASEE